MMRHSKTSTLLWVAALAACAAVIPARAQEINTPAITIKKSNPDQSKPLKAHFEVLHMMRNAIQVRSLTNGLEIHTFSYSESIAPKMQNLFDQGGYQYGDKVEIWYEPGTDVALKIRGKVSKPL